MSDILGIYIIDEKGKLFYEQERYSQGSQEINNAILSNIFLTLQKFASEIGSGDVQRIVIGENPIFLIKDGITNFRFMLRGSENLGEKKAKKSLIEVKNAFIRLFTGSLYKDERVLRKLKSQFSIKLNELLKDFNDMTNFLDSF
jgi:hypothetical protein